MTVLNEGRHPGEFLMSEANRQRSRANITVASGAGIIAPGTVLGKITASGKYLASAVGATDGSQTAVAIALYGCDATTSDVAVAGITRDAEVNGSILTYHPDRDQVGEQGAAHADLASVGIIVR
ncbi:head decoration protein [Roseovarius sp. SYSU LYC5161]|uniref:head decoration protein n=1 Tax=Roseovarius halophilus (ex Wu et al. 2025) TaxID=3376060 RepID=UPI00399A705D